MIAQSTWHLGLVERGVVAVDVLALQRTATVSRNVFRYHLGSLAFGSFIIAVIQFIRALMKYYELLCCTVNHFAHPAFSGSICAGIAV